MPRMSRSEFVIYYANSMRLTVAAVKAAGLIALPCECSAHGCPGWYMANALALSAFGLDYLPTEYRQEIWDAAQMLAEKRRI